MRLFRKHLSSKKGRILIFGDTPGHTPLGAFSLSRGNDGEVVVAYRYLDHDWTVVFTPDEAQKIADLISV
jgi:hypothetical protein